MLRLMRETTLETLTRFPDNRETDLSQRGRFTPSFHHISNRTVSASAKSHPDGNQNPQGPQDADVPCSFVPRWRGVGGWEENNIAGVCRSDVARASRPWFIMGRMPMLHSMRETTLETLTRFPDNRETDLSQRERFTPSFHQIARTVNASLKRHPDEIGIQKRPAGCGRSITFCPPAGGG